MVVSSNEIPFVLSGTELGTFLAEVTSVANGVVDSKGVIFAETIAVVVGDVGVLVVVLTVWIIGDASSPVDVAALVLLVADAR